MSYLVRMFAAFLLCATMMSSTLSAENDPIMANIASVQAVISAQIEAFKRDDGEVAYSFAEEPLFWRVVRETRDQTAECFRTQSFSHLVADPNVYNRSVFGNTGAW